ncbi:hypothetical protein MSG28_001418 [Choristoneura fumiferana]|uniref:Uncharacterized protein n=1 Tax=Choristoneura fumiferana TaxID=7141 RepID=A0ACC0KTZ5_CHOFU|nr:hypothetical protein MSG28_001418 [Choristoneura fumiferana]
MNRRCEQKPANFINFELKILGGILNISKEYSDFVRNIEGVILDLDNLLLNFLVLFEDRIVGNAVIF